LNAAVRTEPAMRTKKMPLSTEPGTLAVAPDLSVFLVLGTVVGR
jgi:hypothetical protein